MKNHLMHAHSLPLNSDYIAALAKYACIYCTSNFHDFEVAKKHLILCHPDQHPYICDRNLLPEKEVRGYLYIFIFYNPISKNGGTYRR